MISITIPVFNEEEVNSLFRVRLVEALSRLIHPWKIVLVKTTQNIEIKS
jgi:hypothetical protein